MLDVGWGDLIYYFGDDPYTKSILLYMESVGDARSFLSAAREVALTKPIIVIKAGRSEAASRAAASHTGALTGSDEVLEAAFPPLGSFARAQYRRSFLYGGGARPAASPERSAAYHPDQRGRTGSPGHRFAGGQWWRTGRAFSREPATAG
jgi:succinyl-CoA synthetase alpha subunit